MRNRFLVVFACVSLIACTPDSDTAHISVFLPPPYAALPAATLAVHRAGRLVSLDARQQQAVVVGVLKWMKDPLSIGCAE